MLKDQNCVAILHYDMHCSFFGSDRVFLLNSADILYFIEWFLGYVYNSLGESTINN